MKILLDVASGGSFATLNMTCFGDATAVRELADDLEVFLTARKLLYPEIRFTRIDAPTTGQGN